MQLFRSQLSTFVASQMFGVRMLTLSKKKASTKTVDYLETFAKLRLQSLKLHFCRMITKLPFQIKKISILNLENLEHCFFRLKTFY